MCLQSEGKQLSLPTTLQDANPRCLYCHEFHYKGCQFYFVMNFEVTFVHVNF